jgi:hypothetical protein
LTNRPIPLQNHHGPLVAQLNPERPNQLSASPVALLQFEVTAIPMPGANRLVLI